MRISSVTFTLARTYNLGNYENIRPEFSATVAFDADEDENVVDAYREAREFVLDQHSEFKASL